MQNAEPRSNPAGGCLARLFWMVVGNLILVLAAVGIGRQEEAFSLGVLDVVFWGAVTGLLAVRYIDIRFLGGQTADSRPASMADWRRYAAVVLGVSLALWLAAHLA